MAAVGTRAARNNPQDFLRTDGVLPPTGTQPCPTTISPMLYRWRIRTNGLHVTCGGGRRGGGSGKEKKEPPPRSKCIESCRQTAAAGTVGAPAKVPAQAPARKEAPPPECGVSGVGSGGSEGTGAPSSWSGRRRGHLVISRRGCRSAPRGAPGLGHVSSNLLLPLTSFFESWLCFLVTHSFLVTVCIRHLPRCCCRQRRPRRGAPRPAVPRAVTRVHMLNRLRPPLLALRPVAREVWPTVGGSAPEPPPHNGRLHPWQPTFTLRADISPPSGPAPPPPPLYLPFLTYEQVPWLKRCRPPSAAPPLSSCLQWTGQWRSRRRPARQPPL